MVSFCFLTFENEAGEPLCRESLNRVLRHENPEDDLSFKAGFSVF